MAVWDLQNEGKTFAALINEINESLNKAYQIHLPLDVAVRGSTVNGINCSLKFLSLIKARDHFRQVLSECELKTYHGNEYLRLRKVLNEKLGIPPKVARLVLPSLREPRHFESRSTGVNWENRYARPDSLCFGIKEYRIATNLPPKFVASKIITKEDLWGLLSYLIRDRWVPRIGIVPVFLKRVDWYIEKSKYYYGLKEVWDNYLHKRRVIKEYYNFLFPNAQ